MDRRALLLGALLVTTAARAQVGGYALTLEPIASGLVEPVGIAHAGDGSGRLFVLEKAGRIRVFDGQQLLPDPFLDLSSQVLSTGVEQGLVGLAFHPDYATNGFFFVSYVDLEGDSIVARYRVSGTDPNLADSTSGVEVLEIDQPFASHNVNQLQFGPDDYLYIGSGDGGPGQDPSNRGQDLTTLLGKVLRLDVNPALTCELKGLAEGCYAIPPDNPFAGQPPARPEIWAYGLRNPWRFTFDRATGDLWLADVGQNRWEEVNLQPAASGGGENYGWRLMEGRHCFLPPEDCTEPGLVLPVLEYPHVAGDDCAVIGGYRYRGTSWPALQGAYLFADFCSGRIRAAAPGCGGGWHTRELYNADFAISSLGEDQAGELYLTEFAASARLFRIGLIPISQLHQDGFESADASAWSSCSGIAAREPD